MSSDPDSYPEWGHDNQRTVAEIQLSEALTAWVGKAILQEREGDRYVYWVPAEKYDMTVQLGDAIRAVAREKQPDRRP